MAEYKVWVYRCECPEKHITEPVAALPERCPDGRKLVAGSEVEQPYDLTWDRETGVRGKLVVRRGSVEWIED